MAFSNEVLREALKKINDRHEKNEKLFEQKYARLYKEHPELEDLDNNIKIKSSKTAMMLFAGKTREAEILQTEISELNTLKKKIIKSAGLPEKADCDCALCKDTGYKDGVLCSCVKNLAAKMCYASLVSDMPLIDSTFDKFDLNFYSEEKTEQGVSPKNQMAGVLKICKNFADNFPQGKNLLLTGRSGLGKTHLSLSIVNEVLNKGYGVIYGSAQNLINEVSRESFDRSGSTDKIDSINSCDLLILDDLGTEFSTSLSSSIVYNIINTRLMKGLSTVISTNLNIKEIGDTYNERVASRIIGSYTICPCLGSDIRLIKAKNALK